ncbi:MAG: cupin domain-containing protein [Gaiellaceae bacterium]|jgi:uncharacterized cupin superfamily protein
MSYRFVDARDLKPRLRVLRPIRKALDIKSFGVNEIELPPDTTAYPEHDELKTNQDELYVVLGGSATMTIDGDTIDLKPGRYVFVTPESRRHIAPGAEGIRFLAVGARADQSLDARH